MTTTRITNPLLKLRVQVKKIIAAKKSNTEVNQLPSTILCEIVLPDRAMAKLSKIRISKILREVYTFQFIAKMEEIAKKEGRTTISMTPLMKSIVMHNMAKIILKNKKDQVTLPSSKMIKEINTEMAETLKAEVKKGSSYSELMQVLSANQFIIQTAGLEADSATASLIKKKAAEEKVGKRSPQLMVEEKIEKKNFPSVAEIIPTTLKTLKAFEDKSREQFNKIMQEMISASPKKGFFEPKENDRVFGLLYKNENGQWLVRNSIKDKQVDLIPDGHYAFIKTKLGFIRISKCPVNSTNHRATSDTAEQIRFAGVVNFAKGEITSWDNVSGNYQPPAELKHLVGFPLEKFEKYTEESTRPASPPRSPESPIINSDKALNRDEKSLSSGTPLINNHFLHNENIIVSSIQPPCPESSSTLIMVK